MKKIVLLHIFIFCNLFSAIHLSAQAPGWIWANSAKGNSYDEASSITSDLNGNIYATGYFFNDTIIFGTDSLFNSGANDVFLVKYNSTGNIIWAKKAGGNGDDYVSAVTTDFVGNIYIVGWFGGNTIDFGTDTTLFSNAGQPDIFIAKYDPNGNFIWARREGGTDYDIANAVVTDPTNGDVYVAGAYYNSSITVGNTTLLNNGLYDELVIKYDLNGNVIWAKGAGGTMNDLGNAIALDKNGNVYVDGGFASASMAFPSATLVNAFGGQPDIFVVKYDSNGNDLWARRAGSTDNDHAVSIAVDTSDNVFVAGHYHSTSFNFASDVLNNMGFGDLFLLKYDSAGNELWGRTAGGPAHDFGYCVTVDRAGNAYYCGMFMSPTITFGSTTLTNASSNEDVYLTKYDPAGNPVWAMRAGGTDRDYMNCVALNAAGNLYVVGVFQSTSVMLGTTTLTNCDTSATTGDIFVGELDVVTGNIIPLSENKISVYPNPSNGIFKIDFGGAEKNNIEIYNSIGEKVFEKENVSGNNLEINLSDEADGIYFVRVTSNGKVSEGEFLKQ